MVRRCGKQKQVHIQTKNPATMINNCINESLVTSFQQYRETRRKCRPQALVKPKMYKNVKRPPGRLPLSIQRPQPSLLQLPLLFQKDRQVVHGGERVRVIRTEVRFAPCKSSAVQGLRLASRDGTGGVGPAGHIIQNLKNQTQSSTS